MRQLKLATETFARIDQLLLEALKKENPGLSRAKLKEAFRNRQVYLRGRAIEASYELAPGTHEIELRDWDPSEATQAEAPPATEGSFLSVVYEDEDLLILHKESGVPSVPHAVSETKTAVGSALSHFPGLRGVGRGGFEPGLLHRLDTGTSGLLAFAKHADEFERIHKTWKEGGVRKIYRAIAPYPAAIPLPATLKPVLGHDARSSKRMRLYEPALCRGKPLPTVTHLRALALVAPAQLAHLTQAAGRWGDFEIEIETGVMHQIRCTLSSLGSPILGDAIYGGTPSPRLWLHAWKLTLPLRNGAELRLESRLPEGWAHSPR